VEVVAEESATEAEIKIEPAEGRKCERCWNYTLDVGSEERYPTICARCARNINEGWS
jgi:isoleucyl-tRNA synthetase